MTIRELPKEHFEKLSEIFDTIFDSDPPRPDHSRIFVCYEGEEPVGFVHCEAVVLLGQMFTVPGRDKNGSIPRYMINFLQQQFDGKVNVAAIASEPRFEKLFDSYGMVLIPGTFHRKNVDFEN